MALPGRGRRDRGRDRARLRGPHVRAQVRARRARRGGRSRPAAGTLVRGVPRGALHYRAAGAGAGLIVSAVASPLSMSDPAIRNLKNIRILGQSLPMGLAGRPSLRDRAVRGSAPTACATRVQILDHVPTAAAGLGRSGLTLGGPVVVVGAWPRCRQSGNHRGVRCGPHSRGTCSGTLAWSRDELLELVLVMHGHQVLAWPPWAPDCSWAASKPGPLPPSPSPSSSPSSSSSARSPGSFISLIVFPQEVGRQAAWPLVRGNHDRADTARTLSPVTVICRGRRPAPGRQDFIGSCFVKMPSCR